ncbi:MAG: hypothetical protein ACJ77R_07830 [Gemmatimonadaceae bacterium]
MSRLTFSVAVLVAIPSTLAAQQAVLASSTDTDPASAAIFETKDAAVLTAGLAPLSKTELRKGEREVRVWYSGFGNPQYLVVIKQKGASVTGRLLLWWDQYYESSPASADVRVDNFVRAGYDCGPISKRDSHFGEDRWISSTCEAKLKGTADWKAFLSEIESRASAPAGAVAAADGESDDEHLGMTVEVRTDASYSASHYRTPLTFGTPQPGRGPKLQDMVAALAVTAKRQPVVAQH